MALKLSIVVTIKDRNCILLGKWRHAQPTKLPWLKESMKWFPRLYGYRMNLSLFPFPTINKQSLVWILRGSICWHYEVQCDNHVKMRSRMSRLCRQIRWRGDSLDVRQSTEKRRERCKGRGRGGHSLIEEDQTGQVKIHKSCQNHSLGFHGNLVTWQFR